MPNARRAWSAAGLATLSLTVANTSRQARSVDLPGLAVAAPGARRARPWRGLHVFKELMYGVCSGPRREKVDGGLGALRVISHEALVSATGRYPAHSAASVLRGRAAEGDSCSSLAALI